MRTRKGGTLVMASRKKLLLLLLVVVCITTVTAMGVYYHLSHSRSRYEDITVDQAYELIETRPSLIILDVRTEAEYTTERIAGAINIPLDELPHRLGELNKTDSLLVYCRTGNRSTQAANLLVENEFQNFYHMQGGIEVWKQHNYPVIP